MTKTVEFDTLIEMGKCEVFDFPTEKNIEKIETHYDKDKKKYVVTVEYGKKA